MSKASVSHPKEPAQVFCEGGYAQRTRQQVQGSDTGADVGMVRYQLPQSLRHAAMRRRPAARQRPAEQEDLQASVRASGTVVSRTDSAISNAAAAVDVDQSAERDLACSPIPAVIYLPPLILSAAMVISSRRWPRPPYHGYGPPR